MRRVLIKLVPIEHRPAQAPYQELHSLALSRFRFAATTKFFSIHRRIDRGPLRFWPQSCALEEETRTYCCLPLSRFGSSGTKGSSNALQIGLVHDTSHPMRVRPTLHQPHRCLGMICTSRARDLSAAFCETSITEGIPGNERPPDL